MNSALPIEEAYRDSKDNNTTLQLHVVLYIRRKSRFRYRHT